MFAGWERVNTFSTHRSASHQLSVSQTDPFISSRVRLTWMKREGRPSLTPLHSHCLLQLTNLGLLRGIQNANGVSGIWELLIEQFSDRGKGLGTPSKWKSVEAFSPPCVGTKSFLQKKKKIWILRLKSVDQATFTLLVHFTTLDNLGPYFCSLRPKLEAAPRFICSKLRKSWKETLQLLPPSSYNLI